MSKGTNCDEIAVFMPSSAAEYLVIALKKILDTMPKEQHLMGPGDLYLANKDMAHLKVLRLHIEAALTERHVEVALLKALLEGGAGL